MVSDRGVCYSCYAKQLRSPEIFVRLGFPSLETELWLFGALKGLKCFY